MDGERRSVLHVNLDVNPGDVAPKANLERKRTPRGGLGWGTRLGFRLVWSAAKWTLALFLPFLSSSVDPCTPTRAWAGALGRQSGWAFLARYWFLPSTPRGRGNELPERAELTDYYTSLHPLMRIAASTYLLFDRDAVVTDPGRTAEDYLQMGLPINEASLHFKLQDRYVHAMDLRTIGRSPLRNRMTAAYFRLMGFRSLHHVGTEDHLHLSLPLPSDT